MSGSILLRLSFKATETPLEEAMEQIETYFKSVQGDAKTVVPTPEVVVAETIPIPAETTSLEESLEPRVPPEPVSSNDQESATNSMESSDNVEKDKSGSSPQALSTPLIVGLDQRPSTIHLPPTTSTPRAAQQAFNEKDYVPSIAHAKLHQARLESSSRNKTLLSDKELAEKEKAKAQKLADVKQIEIKIKFPDECTVSAPFSSADTSDSLYSYTRTLLDRENQPFSLSFPDAQGRRKPVPHGSDEKLISGLGMSGKTLVHFSWEPGATPQPRSVSVLKPEMRAQAKEIEIQDPPVAEAEEDPVVETSSSKKKEPGKGGSKGVPKWFKGLGKK